MKKISVLLPSYNSAAFIKASIISVLNQTFKDFNLFIIDDGSTDNTEEIVKSFQDARLFFIKKEHSGLADTLNYGLKIAETEIVARMDSDDIALPYRLEKQYNFLQRNKIFDVVSSWYVIFKNDGIKYIVRTSENSSEIKKKLLLYSEISHPASLINKNKILNLGGYRSLNAFEDYDLWLRGKENLNFYNIPEVLLFQRYREDSLSRDNLRTKYKLQYEIQEFYYQKEEIMKFGIKDSIEESIYRGWREYFYGDRKRARYFWLKSGIGIFKSIRVLIAFIITFLTEDLFIQFKENRVRYRVMYYIKYYSKENINLRKIFSSIYNQNATP